MSFLRHVGKHGDRKVALIFREVPGEPHMCLVTYTELLNQNIHDPIISCIESDIGQSSENLADALNRMFTKDGRPILQVLHMEGQLKKVNTEAIVMTPQPNTKIKLNELNKILDEMKQGEAAVKRLADLDKSLGMQDPGFVRKMKGERLNENIKQQALQNAVPAQGILGDTQIADNLVQQAQRMATEAKGLLAEADRLMKEANAMSENTLAIEKPVLKMSALGTKRGRGRPAKVTVV